MSDQQATLDQVFRTARTFNKFKPDAISDDTLQALQFFSLPSRMTVQTSHVLREDGTVQTQWLQRSDEPATRICVAVSPGQERCVTFTASAAPADLVRFADQVFAGHVRR